jgi:endonuclease/exonuclease/phosphatase family metal-dependent hydrolase
MLTHSTLVPCTTGGVRSMKLRQALRVATWNIRAARSASLEEIAAELEAMQADIVALQEVDVRVRRTGFRDQPVVLAAALGFHHVFAATIGWDGGDYGLAVLSRWPLADVRRHRLEHTGAGEPRIVLEVTVCAGGRPLRLFNHHADVGARSRGAGLAVLRELVSPALGRGVLVLGDFNDGPDATGVRALIQAGLVDLGAERNVNTAASGRIDYLLVDTPLARMTSSTQVWTTGKSDHHALMADLDW